MTTGVFLLSPGPVFASANAQAVHSNAVVTTSGSTVLSGFGNHELDLVINLTAAPSGVLPTIQFSLQAVDPGDGTTAIGSPLTGAVLSAIGTEVLTLALSPTGAVRVSWTVTGTTPSFSGVYATMVSKIASPEVEGQGTAGSPAGGVVSIQGVPGGTPLPISGTVSATNPSVDANAASAPGFSTQVGGSDGTNLQATRVHDLDTGGGTEFDLGVSLRLPGAGGSVAGGTAMDPLRVDPTGTTTQPVSVTSLPLPTGAATEATLLTRVADATITARLNTLGQKLMAVSAPVVLASDQSPVAVAGSDGSAHQEVRVHDLDTGGGTEFDLGVSLRFAGAGGSIAAGTSANPLRTDTTGATTQPISAVSLPLPTGAATEATLSTRVADATITARLNTLGQKTMAASAPVVLASDQSRLPISTEVQADYNTGAGTQSLSLIGLAVPTAGGAVAGGTSTNPLRTDPTGTTTQPVSATALPLPTGAATEATLSTRVSDATVTARLNTLGQKVMASSAPVVIASDQSALAVTSTQLPASLVSGRLDTNIGTWLGSTSPTIGQKLMGMSLPVVIASDQTAIPVSGTITATNPSVDLNSTPAPTSSTQVGGTDGTNLRPARVYDLDTGVGNVYDLGVSLRLPASGGSVTGGTGTNPIRTDPTGTTTQPVSAAALPLPAGAATELTLSTRVSDATIITRLNTLGQKVMTGSAPVVIASDQTAIPITGSVTATNPSVSAINSGFPGSATQIGLSDGVNLRVPRVYDLDTGGGLEFGVGTILRASASGGSVETGVSAHPLRVDPTGTTTQPISAVSLPLPTGAATDRTTAVAPFAVRLTDGGGFYTAPQETQLPSALVAGRLDTNVGAWLGSTSPTVGQKTMAASLPVVLASDQSVITVTGTVTAANPSVGTNAAAAPLSSTQIGGTDGTSLWAARSFDLHTGLATEWNLGVSLRLPGVTGSVAGGTSTDPFRVDPTGTTTQPISAASLPLPTGAATEATLATRVADATITARLNTLGQKAMAASAPVVIASDQSTIPVSGTVTANIGTTAGLALDATLTGGTQKAIVRGGAKGATVAADVTSTAEGSNHQALDVQIYHGATAIDPSTVTSWIGSTAPTVGQKAMASSLPVVVASDQTSLEVDSLQLPAALVGGRLDTNNGAWLGSTAPTVGQKTSANSLPVVIASDQSSLAVTSTQLPGALVSGRLDVNVGAWLGSVSPTVGQKSMTTSIPVVVASDQTALPVTDNGGSLTVDGTVTANIGTTNGLALDATLTGGTQKAIVRGGAKGATVAADVTSTAEGADHQAVDVQIYHGGAAINPTQIRALTAVDVVSVEVNDWLGSTAPTVGQKTMANSLPVVIASNQSAIPITGTITASNPSVSATNAAVPAEATQIGGSDGTNLQTLRVFDVDTGAGAQYVAGVSLRKAASGGSVEAGTSTDPLRVDPTGTTAQPVTDNGGSLTVDGTVTANIGTTNGLALDATLTGGTQKAIVRGGTKGATVAADVTSTAEGADHQSLDIQIYHGGAAINPTVIRALTNVDVVSSEVTTWLGSTAPTVGQKTMANSLPVVIASNQSAIPISGSITATNPSVGPTDDPVPTDATQIGGSDGTNLQTLRVFDVDTGAGAEFVAGVSLRKSASGGSVEAGTSSDPLRVDPTGTTAQPVTDNGGSLTVDGTVTANIGTTNGLALNATLTGGTQTTRVTDGTNTAAVKAASTAPLATDPALVVSISPNSTLTAVNPSVGLNEDPAPTSSTQIGGSDGTDLQAVRVFDGDSGAGAEYVLGTMLRKSASGGSVEAGTSTDPLRVDPTGATTQPISAVSLPLPTGAATEASLSTRLADATFTGRINTLGQKAMAASTPVVLASDQTVIPVSDNGASLTVDTTQLPAALVGGRLDANIGAWLGSTAPTVGQKTSANSLPVVIASDQSAVLISAAALPLPAGAATEATLATRLADATFTARINTLGQKTSANSTPIVIASDQSTIEIEGSGVAGTPAGGVLTIQGDPAGEPIPITGAITATNPSVGPTEDPVPTDATQIGGSDGTDLQAIRVFDGDSGAGTEYILGTMLRASASGGTVEAGTSTDPLRVDPTGTTTQPISAVALPLPTGAATEATLATRLADATFTGRINTLGQKAMAASTPVVLASDQTVIPVSDNGGSLTVDSTQLPAALVGARLDVNNGAWLGSTAPTVGQKASAASLPVVIASDQSAIPVTGSFVNTSIGATGDPVPSDATQIGGSDGTNLQTPRVFDADSGAGEEFVFGAILRKSASGGSVEAGTSTDPLRVDPTGTTAQPVTDNGGSLTVDGTVTANIGTTNGLALDATLTGGTQKAIVRGGAKGATVAADVTSTAEGADHQGLDVQIYHGGAAINPTAIRALTSSDVVSSEITKWLGSTAPTVGQKAMAASLPVVIASDQSAIPVTGSFVNTSIGATGDPVPTDATQIGGSDGTNLQTPRVFDADSDVGEEFVLGAILRKSALGGSVEAGTSTDPLRVDPTGTTTQPVSDAGGSLTVDTTQLPAALVGARLDVNNGAWLGSTAPTVGQKTMANSVPTVLASDQTAIPVTDNGGSLTVDGTVTANIGTTNGLALDATLTGGTQKAIVRGGAKGSTVAADVTSTAEGADHQGLDVQIYHGGAAINPTAIRALTNTDVVSAEITTWLGSTAPTVGQKTMADSLPVVIASDQTAIAVTGSFVNTSVGATGDPVPTDATQVGGSDGTNLQTLRVFDADTGAGEEYVAGVSLRKSASGGSVEAGTATDPLRVDPTGTTAQPVTDNGGSLTVDGTVTANVGTTGGLALDATLTGGTQKAIIRGGAKGATVAADVTSTAEGADHQAVDVQIYHGGAAINPTAIRALTAVDVVSVEVNDWLGSTAPTVGQKAMAASLPVVVASDQSTLTIEGEGVAGTPAGGVLTIQGDPAGEPIPITGSITAINPSVGPTEDPVPTDATQIGGSDGTDLQAVRVFDADTGAGAEYVMGVSLRKSASGGSVEAGTSTDPLRVDPTGTTAQPVTDNGGSLTVDTTQLPAALVGARLDVNNGAWLGSTAPTVGQKTMANSVPTVLASDQTAIPVTDNGGSLTVDGTVTANIGTTNGLALDATLTGGTQKAIVRGGAKGATVAADVTSTAEGADHQGLDVQIYHGGAAINPTAIRALTSADVVTVEQGTAAALSGYWPVRVTDGTNTMPTGDAVARAIFHKVTDGTNTAAVKAASTAAVAADPALVVSISPNTAPIVQTVGAHANAWNATAVGAGGTSTVIDCQYTPFVTAFGNSSGATTISLQVSQDNSNFYTVASVVVGSGGGDFAINATTGARYMRLMSSSARTITATITGKS